MHKATSRDECPGFAQNGVNTVVDTTVTIESFEDVTSCTATEGAPIETSESDVINRNEVFSD